MELTNMTIDELNARHAEIGAEIDSITDIETLNERSAEVEAIKAELEARKKIEAEKAELRQAVADGQGEVRTKEITKETTKMEKSVNEIRSSVEYMNAYANYIKTGKADECRALLSTNNESGTVAVPVIVDDIVRHAWDNEEIMALVNKTNLKGNVKVGFEISATGAVVHTEGDNAPNEETLTLGIVTMVPASIKKWITISDEVVDLTSEAFLRYIYEELTYQIAKKCADLLVAKIIALPTTATSTSVNAAKITEAPAFGTIAKAIANLSDEATNPVVVMNKATWANFKAAQYAGNFAADIFEGLKVVFNNSLPAYDSASAAAVYMFVGDLGRGAQANYPAGDITIKYDDISLAEKDLVKLVGREFVGLGCVAPKCFTNIAKPAAQG